MEKVVFVNVLQTGKNLVEDALDAAAVEVFVLARLHELIQITIHVLHGNVQLSAQRVQKYVVCWYEMWVIW